MYNYCSGARTAFRCICIMIRHQIVSAKYVLTTSMEPTESLQVQPHISLHSASTAHAWRPDQTMGLAFVHACCTCAAAAINTCTAKLVTMADKRRSFQVSSLLEPSPRSQRRASKRSFRISSLLEPSPRSSKRRRLLLTRVGTPVTPKRKQVTPRRWKKRTPKRYRSCDSSFTEVAASHQANPRALDLSCLDHEGRPVTNIPLVAFYHQ